MTSHAPTHRKGLIDLLEHTHLLNLSVAGGAVDVGGDMPHVRKVNMVGDFVDPHPRDRLLVVPVVPHFLDLGLLPLVGSTDDLVAAEACPHRWDSGVHRSFGREVTVLTIDSVDPGVDVMRKGDRLGGGLLARGIPLRRRIGALSLNEGQ